MKFFHFKQTNDVQLALAKSIENNYLCSKDTVETTIYEIVNHRFNKFFFVEGNEILNEQTIIQGGIIKPDRMVFNKGGTGL
jgi:hypothetical protein